jgi:hypothetical protein
VLSRQRRLGLLVGNKIASVHCPIMDCIYMPRFNLQWDDDKLDGLEDALANSAHQLHLEHTHGGHPSPTGQPRVMPLGWNDEAGEDDESVTSEKSP